MADIDTKRSDADVKILTSVSNLAWDPIEDTDKWHRASIPDTSHAGVKNSTRPQWVNRLTRPL